MQHICVNTQLKKPIYAIKIERTGTQTQTKKSVRNFFFVYRYRVFWAGQQSDTQVKRPIPN